ncbi:hypothetical protein H257_15254 [Aphanomyces astaci]|uniref:Glutathione S-transferase 3, mitochondrial n=3 Tax=Aphanomyces astaci TaxID=112090 RepID=W4FQF1_APHAT|nr:hypothetical protein, variant 1 [Aphanomyces astaci]XP_009841586.1 hypothetical protein H257_15254 [Aphanomyces astaci]ETV68907.1 hypothetical protein H257_15254 [Aphanomyces astaci]ETV68908.1 hypothetical protein, variant 1 [Aphanomyces astaci]|eukprot:XP_009841585.1 hypothetical protein, variant 1 [Aphanomyces astaci]
MVFVAPTLQPEHGYIILVVVLVAFVNLWAGFKVGAARRLYGIAYPQMYAETKDEHFLAFNCVQRAHQNVLENLPTFLSLLFVSSVYRPLWAAIAGLVRVIGFIVYIHFYSSGDPAKRQYGAFGYIGLLTLVGLCFEAAFRLITE